MKKYQNTTLGLQIVIDVPETAEEFDKLAGRTGACVEEAVRNVIYRSVNPEFRRNLCERLEKETGIERASKTTGEGDDAKTVYTQTEKEYYNSFLVDGHIDEETAQMYANEIAATLTFDPSPTTRAKKAPKEIETAARHIMDAIKSGTTDEDTVKSKFVAVLGIESFDASFGDLTEESLVRALVADKEKQDRERTNKFV